MTIIYPYHRPSRTPLIVLSILILLAFLCAGGFHP